MKKIARIFLYTITGIILLSVALLIVMNSTPGLKFCLNLLKHSVPGTLTIKESQGRLLHQLTLIDIDYTDKGNRVHIKKLQLDWHLLSLLLGTQSTSTLTLDNTTLHLAGDEQTINFKQLIFFGNTHNINMKAELTLPFVANIQATLKNPMTNKHINLHIATLGGTINGSGTFTQDNTLTWQATLTAKNINPETRWHDWPGNINFQLKTQGALKDQNFTASLCVDQLTGSIRKNPLRGKVNANINSRHITFEHTRIALGDASFKIDGHRGKTWDLSWILDIPNLYTLTPHGSGQLNSQGHISGNKDTPTMHASLSASHLKFKTIMLEAVNGSADIDLNPKKSSTALIIGKRLTLGTQKITSLTLKLSGFTEKHTLDIALQKQQEKFDMSLDGRYQKGLWQGTIGTINILLKHENHWSLASKTPFYLSEKRRQLFPLTLQNKQQKIILQSQWIENTAWNSQVDIQHLNLNHLNSLLPAGVSLTGNLNANAKISRVSSTTLWTGDLTGVLGPGALHYKDQKTNQTMPYQDGQLHATLNKKGFNAFVHINLDDHTPLTFTASLPGYRAQTAPKSTQALKAQLQLTLKKLDVLPRLFPLIHDANGILTSNLSVSGTLGNPSLSGELRVSNGNITLPRYGLNLQNIQIFAEGQKDNTLKLRASAHSGKGFARIDGTVKFIESGIQSRLHLSGERFQAINTEEYAVILSPKIDIDYKPKNLNINGDIIIHEATLKPKDFSSTDVLPDNIHYIGAQKEKTTPLAIYSQLNITLEKAKLLFHGVDAELAGKLAIQVAPNKPTLAKGELGVTHGHYQAYGQHLTIEKGQLIYNNNDIDNPGLVIRAIREIKSFNQADTSHTAATKDPGQAIHLNPTIQTITVGIEATGSLDETRITLFSRPQGISQADILSYLILGQPQSGASGAQGTLLLQAVSSMDIGGGSANHIADELQQTLGLNELKVESTPEINPDSNQAEDNTSLVIGKRITKRLTAEYSVGLIVPVNVLHLIYTLGRHWSIQTTTSSYDNGADLFYTIERD